MKKTKPPQVLQVPPWLQSKWLLAAAAFALFLFGWVCFTLGRNQSGARVSQVVAIDPNVAGLRRQVAELDTIKASQEKERQEVSRTIGELQAEVASKTQQLNFYRGIVVNDADKADVRIRQLRIADGSKPGNFIVRLTLAQEGKPDKLTSGEVLARLDGTRAGRAARLDLAQLPYSFRFFKNIELGLQVPVDFKPERLTVEVKPAGLKSPLTQTMIWTVDGG